jgi:phenylacetate-CoA ligase
MLNWLSKRLFYPLWEFKNGGIGLKTLRELEKSQWLTEDELRKSQWEKLEAALNFAYNNCEFYKSAFDRNNLKPSDIKEEADFLKVPILTKKHIRYSTDELISRLCRKEDLVMIKTGGSTGKSLFVYCDKECRNIRNAAAMRSDGWANWEPGDKRAAIWGNPTIEYTFKGKIRRMLLNRVIFLDTMDLNENSMSDFVDLYFKYKPSVIFGHSHSIFMFSKFIESKKIKEIKPKGIISTSMMLMSHERETIEKVFKCKVTDRYGCEEVGLIACECEKHEGMHLNIEHLYIEFVKDDGEPAGPGEEGAIVVTDLVNRGMPLIRYRVEDIGVPTDRKCACGRGLPMMKRVSGRTADFLIRRDGSLVAGISLIERTLTAIEGIEQMQIVQKAMDDMVLNIVKGKDYNMDSEKLLLDEFRNVFGGNTKISINYTDRIPQERSGKYRFSICEVKGQ